jgi:hypothetical protein
MTCATAPTKFAGLAGRAGGLSRLAGQRAFYAGLAAGVAGTLGVQQAMKRARRRSASGFALTPSPPLQPIPALEGDPPKSKPRRIPALENYSPGTRTNPRPIPALEGDPPKPKPRRIPALEADPPDAQKKARPIPGLAAPPTETQLKPESIQVRTGSGQVVAAPDSYRVMRRDGSDTGLALTPALTANGEPEANRWGVTHTASGSLVSGPYPDLKQAQSLAIQLAGLRWTNLRVPAEDIEQARTIIAGFQPVEDGQK